MPSYTVAVVIILALVGACAVAFLLMVGLCYLLDGLGGFVVRRFRARRQRAAEPRATVAQLSGRWWMAEDNELYLSGFAAWIRTISPESHSGE